MTERAPKVTYKIILKPMDGPVDVTSRLKRLLKFALRSCGLRCLRIERHGNEKQSPRM